MPQVGAWLATAAFPTLLGSAITYGTLIKTALVVGVGMYSRRQQKKARASALDSIRDRTFMVRSAVTTRPIVYGRTRLSGPFRPIGTHGTDGEMFSFTVSLAGALDAVEEVWFNDSSIGALDAAGWTTTGDYFKSRSEPAFHAGIVSASRTVTLPHLADAITIVSVPMSDSYDNLYPGDPSTDHRAWSVATVGGVSVLTFHADRIGTSVTINYQRSSGEAKARAKAFLGQAGQAADPYLIGQFPSLWTGDHRSDGASYLSCTLVYDPDVYPTGVPNVSAVVRGKRIYDPRTGLTSWSRNPALIARDYLGAEFGCESSEIDDASVIAAANACDEVVNYTSTDTHERYTFDGALDSGTNRLQNLETILASMAGTATFSAGKWYLRAGVWATPTLALNEHDLAGDGAISIQAFAARRDLFNGVRGTYTDSSTWQQTDFPAYTSPTYQAQDGDDEAILDVELPMVTDVYRAQRLAKLALFRARQALTFSASWNLGAYEVTPGDMVEVTLGRYGWTDKVFRCIDREYDPSGGVRFTFQEDAEALYAWDYSEAVNPDPAPNTNLPSVRRVEPPVMTFESGLQFAQALSDGSTRPFLRAYWTQMDATVEHVEIMWRRPHETTWQHSGRIDADELTWDIYNVGASDDYIVWARAINGLGVKSVWVAYLVSVHADAPANSGSVTLGIGVNLLPNATFRNGAAGWAAQLGQVIPFADAPAPVTHLSRTWYASRIWSGQTAFGAWNRPIPGNALILLVDQGAAGTGLGTIYSTNQIPVNEGARIEAQAWLGGHNAGAHLAVMFYDPAGTYVAGSVVTGGNSDLGSGTGEFSLDAYDHCWGFAEVPAGASTAALRIIVDRTATGSTDSWVLLAQPYLGIARPGQTQPSTWSIGPAGGAIEGLDAVTEIIEATVSEQDMDASPTLFDQAFTPQYDAVVEITITAAMTGDLVNTGVGKAYCGLEVILYAGTSSGSSLVIDRSRIIPWSPTLVGETHSAQGAQTITYDVNAGQLYTVKVAKFVDATKFDNVVVNTARLRITEVYR